MPAGFPGFVSVALRDAVTHRQSTPSGRLGIVVWACLLGAGALGGCSSPAAAPKGGLLRDRRPTHFVGVYRPERATDGVRAPDGAAWQSPLTAPFGLPNASLRYELPEARPIFSVVLQAVGTYELLISEDGEELETLWRTGREAARSELRTQRFEANGRLARVIELRSVGARPPRAVAELAIYARRLADDGDDLRIESAPATPPIGALVAKHARLKLAAGVLAMLLLATWWRRSTQRSTTSRRALHAFLAGLGALCWSNFGEFHGRWDVHAHDAFHYYVGARYAADLGRTGLYDCTLQAEIENANWPIAPQRRIRDLATNESQPLESRRGAAQRCRARFDDARWAAFRADVSFFQSQISPTRWERVLEDHGYNASPVFTLIYGALFEHVRATPHGLRALAFLDPALFVIGFTAIGWACGIELLALALLVFGLGFPWVSYWTAGGLGRASWLLPALLGLAASARRAPRLAGGLLGLAGALQPLPLVLLLGPALKWGRAKLRRERASRELSGLLLGAAGVLAVSWTLVIAAQGADAVSAFVANTAKYEATEMGNSMGVGTATGALPVAWLWHRGLQLALCAALLIASLRVRDSVRLLSFGALWLVPLLEVTSYYYVLLVLLAPWAAGNRPRLLVLLAACLLTQLPLLTANALPGRDYYVLASWVFIALAGLATWLQLRAPAPERT